jgi:BirA family transcriptional regulator, biotin operon repressor / biotin---[acetyl-CoA-carboxylase] ligase
MQHTDLDPDSIELPPGWWLHSYTSVSSTQNLAREAASREAGSRHVFLADFQFAGRGRSGRDWVAPAESALLFTVLLLERGLKLHEHTMCVSVSVCETLEHMMALKPLIKWPNDVLIDDRKVCGVLAESTDASPGYVAVGLGLNIAWGGVRPPGVPEWATALDEHSQARMHRGRLLEDVIRSLDAWLSTTSSAVFHDQLRSAWESRLWRRGELVTVKLDGRVVQGHLRGTDADGALIISMDDGQQASILNGELILPGRPSRSDR